MIQIKNIYKSFSGKEVLNNISATFESGKTNLTIGRSGSGKTVLMKCMVGLETINSGQILFDGKDMTSMSKKERHLLREKIGMVFQNGALFDSMNVADNVRFPLRMFCRMTAAEMDKRVDFCLDRVNMKNVHSLTTSELSGGMRKRVAIARAIVTNPMYLFCDEPNSGLDPQTSIVIDSLIKEITEEYNITTIVNTHDMNSVMGIGDHIIFIYNGNLWWEGNRHNITKTTNPELNDFMFNNELTKLLKASALD
ncbi:MAG: ATP-binding cassette domain-containing protein [Bacteroidales bacterium]|jgi:phospholipid/cholesterol/gamma-HCH transport system ATP-binding protein|nr:ATP-binding cassette domain-containing protein [Bacteroidales bacterium]